ncbi:MAG TPA: hypothetical protein VMV48_13665 [Gallionellaceae bacterium]|nr:hypothetical protein [Gallionellaceae bacterium]
MYSINLDNLITEFPEEKIAVQKLAAFLDSASATTKATGTVRELTVPRIYDLIHPSSQRVLAKMLSRLVQQGIFKKIIRVESDALGGIGDFRSIEEVPTTIFDGRKGYEVKVNLENIRLIYRLERNFDK